MDITGSHPASLPASPPIQAVRDTVESDPAYDYAEDTPIDDGTWDEEGEGDESAATGDERVVPLDADEFRAPEDGD